MSNKSQKTVKQLLDERSVQLGDKHATLLEQMTLKALNHKETTHLFLWSKTKLVLACSMLLIIGIMFRFLYPTTQ